MDSVLFPGRVFAYKQNVLKNVTLKAGQSMNFIDVANEHGILQLVEFHGNRKNLGIKVDVYGMNESLFCNVEGTFADVASWGWGVAPGDLKKNPDGTAPDPTCTTNPMMPYITRWKDTMAEVDALGQDDCWYSMAFTPQMPLEYFTRLQVKLFNTGTSDALIRRLYVQRVVFPEKRREELPDTGSAD